jgi:exopolysaccharide biosynthesis polyprenyl glycosylphosphotransferase
MPKEHFLLAVALCLIGMMVLRVAVHHMSLRPQAERRVLAVLPPSGLKLLNDLSEPVRANISQAQFDTDAEGRVAPDARQALREALRQEQFAEVVLSDALTLDAEIALDLASRQRHGLRVRSLSRYLAEETGRLPHDDPETLRNLLIRARPRSGAALLPKRVMDLTLSLVLLILLMPVIVIAVILVRLEDGGPVLYRQTRVGLNQKPFTLLKFRSMRVDAEANGVARWADRRDSRVTRFGAFMRLSRIDELPQLLNVLRGDMSLVGPRPERPEMIAKLKEHIPSYDFRHLVPPGLTGWAQINYPYGASIEDAIQKTNYDLYYVANRSCIRDGLILMETIRVVLFAEGSR